MGKNRRLPDFARRHIIDIVLKESGPRYTIARKLKATLFIPGQEGRPDMGISFGTSLDYVQAALNEGTLVKVGMELGPNFDDELVDLHRSVMREKSARGEDEE